MSILKRLFGSGEQKTVPFPFKTMVFPLSVEGKGMAYVPASLEVEPICDPDNMGVGYIAYRCPSCGTPVFKIAVMVPPPGAVGGDGKVTPESAERRALAAARFELVTLHGLVAADGAAPGETFPIDTLEVIKLIDEALNKSSRTDSQPS